MTKKKLYALTDAEARRLRALARESATTVSNYALDALTPVAVDDLGDDAIERMARALSEHWRDMHTNESLGQQRMLACAALAALLDQEEE